MSTIGYLDVLSLPEIAQVYLARSKGPLTDEAAMLFPAANQRFITLVARDPASAPYLFNPGSGIKLDVVMHDILMRDDFLEEPQVRSMSC